MLKKAQRDKKNPKKKETKENESAKLPAAFNELSGTIELVLQIENGEIFPVSFQFNPSQKNNRKQKAGFSSNGETKNAAAQTEYIYLRENKILQRVYLSEILFIQAMGDYVSIYLKDRKITIHQNLKALETKLPVSRFIRIHRSFMVSKDRIDAIEESTVYINSHPVPIGEAYKSKLMKILSIIR